ncbi:MAG: hypothetical protein C5B59_10625 [Bacteroidetes bacterium]|nr:MAG: hypothetical protein C5B59_10625 [Bacteroidota bacterium]
MEKVQSIKYGRISLFFVAILVGVAFGFYKSYIIFFPSFSNFQFVDHFHGAMMLIWLLFLIIQPLLIKTGRIQIHKAIGRTSYIVAPLLAISIFLVARLQYHKFLATTPLKEATAVIGLSIPPLIAFAIFYSLAIANKGNTPSHLRYMIATALLMIPPGIGRVLMNYFHVPFPVAVSSTYYFTIAIAAIFLAFDVIKKRNYRPNMIVLVVLVLTVFVWEIRYSDAWQATGKLIARWCF